MTQFTLRTDGREYPVGTRGVPIGRAPGNRIVVPDPMASGRHALVWLQGGQLYVRDEGSTNGTYVNQRRIRQPQPLQVGDLIRVGSTTLTVAVGAGSSGMRVWLPLLLMVGAVAIIGVVALLATRRTAIPSPTSPASTARPPMLLTVTPLQVPRRPPTGTPLPPLERARRATVAIIGDTGSGSGGIVDARGYVLTNYHVVAEETMLFIAVNGPKQDTPPEVAYQAEIVDGDEDLDLALLLITADEDGQPLPGPLDLVTVSIGDSDRVGLGDAITILGFPGVGGETLTLSRGTVAGFHEDELGHERGWIKTDAEISPGNSGGVAINAAGEWIGVPTWVSAEERTLGRIGVLRPINLGRRLLGRIP